MQGAVRSLACLFFILAGCSKDADPATEPALGQRPAPSKSVAPEGQEPKTPAVSEPEVVFQTESGEVRVQLEVVASPALTQRGLMYRKHLAPDRGMLFVFGADRVRSFWMKNTLIPLDMLFVRSDFTIAGIVHDAVPLTLTSRSVGIKTRYVIEVNGGWTAKHGVVDESTVRFENMPTIHNPPL